MRIGACQTPEVLGDVERAIGIVRDLAESADADLLLFPEAFLQGYLVTEEHVGRHALALGSPEFAAVLGALAGLRPLLVIGVLERDGPRFHNTAVVIDRGRLAGRYRKTHLTPGEAVFTPGDDYPVFDHAGLRFGINICYDMRFGEAAAAVAAAGAQVLLGPAQNMMRREKAVAWQPRHAEITAGRARETGLWIARADVTGDRGQTHVGLGPTGFIDPAGEVVALVAPGVTGMVTLDLAT